MQKSHLANLSWHEYMPYLYLPGQIDQNPDIAQASYTNKASAVALANDASSSMMLSIIVPTFNELENVEELIRRLKVVLAGVHFEIIFVDDDSPDGTAQHLRTVARNDPYVRIIQRIGRRGLSSACIEGMLASAAPFVAVIDADMQHDERLLPKMLELLHMDKADLVVGSRYIGTGSVGDWDNKRSGISRFATVLAQQLLKTRLSDPMSGFFMIRHSCVVDAVHRGISNVGFKILLDLIASSPHRLRIGELPYQFRTRHAGESKLDTYVVWEYFMLLLDKLAGGRVPVRFIAFSLVGGLGVFVHMAVLSLFYGSAGLSFLTSQTIATLTAMTTNFALNNWLTYRDKRLKGWAWLKGYLSFTVACGIGAIANVGIANYLFEQQTFWMLSAILGILIGAVWNYVITAVYTWKQ